VAETATPEVEQAGRRVSGRVGRPRRRPLGVRHRRSRARRRPTSGRGRGGRSPHRARRFGRAVSSRRRLGGVRLSVRRGRGRRRHCPADRRRRRIERRPVPAVVAAGPMVGVAGRGLRAGVRRGRRARTAGRRPRAGPPMAGRLLFRHATRQGRRPAGRRPVPAAAAAVRRPVHARNDLAVRAVRARLLSGGHRRRLDGRVPRQASLRRQDRVQPLRENRVTTTAANRRPTMSYNNIGMTYANGTNYGRGML